MARLIKKDNFNFTEEKAEAVKNADSTHKEELADSFPEAKTEVKDDITSLFQPEEVK